MNVCGWCGQTFRRRRPGRSDEIVHHKNGNGSDDRIENLELTTRAEHINTHRDDLVAGQRRMLAA